MAFNGSGVFSLVSGNPVVTGTTISSTWANNTLSDIATGLSTTITKDGQTTPTANIPMGGVKITGVGAATTNGDALRFENIALMGSSIQAQTYTAFTTGGTTTAYTLTPTPAITSLVANQRFRVQFNAANTSTTPTLAISGLTAKALKIYDATGAKVNPLVGSFPINLLTDVEYDGTDYVVINPRQLATTAEVQAGTATTLSPSVDSMRNGLIVLGTPLAATSGTALSFTAVPAWVKELTMSLYLVSTTGTSPLYFRVGSGSFATTGYTGSTVEVIGGGTATYSDGWRVGTGSANAAVYHGTVTMTLVDATNFIWSINGIISRGDAGQAFTVSGSVKLSAALDRVQLTTAGGTDTFDTTGGVTASVNITMK